MCNNSEREQSGLVDAGVDEFDCLCPLDLATEIKPGVENW